MSYPVMSYAAAHKWEPLAKKQGVSEVARSSRGFMRAYQRAGSFAKLPDAWKKKREAFIARHMAQGRTEKLWVSGKPSRRALALIMWAYMPPGKTAGARPNPGKRPTTNSLGKPIAKTAEGLRNFWKWFGDSKVVDDQGRPLVVYHHGGFDERDGIPFRMKDGIHFGSKEAAEHRAVAKHVDDFITEGVVEFDEDHGRWYWSSEGIDSFELNEDGFETEAEAQQGLEGFASELEAPEEIGGILTAAYLRIENPHPTGDMQADWSPAIAAAKRLGKDGIRYRNNFEDKGSISWLVWGGTQIKSINNRGTYDPKDPVMTNPSRRKANPPDPRILLTPGPGAPLYLDQRPHLKRGMPLENALAAWLALAEEREAKARKAAGKIRAMHLMVAKKARRHAAGIEKMLEAVEPQDNPPYRASDYWTDKSLTKAQKKAFEEIDPGFIRRAHTISLIYPFPYDKRLLNSLTKSGLIREDGGLTRRGGSALVAVWRRMGMPQDDIEYLIYLVGEDNPPRRRRNPVDELRKKSGLTAIKRATPSIPTRWIVESFQDLKGARLLHAGAGRPDNPDRRLLGKHSRATHYDPNHGPTDRSPLEKADFDIVYSPYVLNTLPPEYRVFPLKDMVDSMKPGGIGVVAVRSAQDIASSRQPTWKKHQDGWLVPNKGFQRGFTGPELKEILQHFFHRVEIVPTAKRDGGHGASNLTLAVVHGPKHGSI